MMKVYWPARRLLPQIMHDVNRIAGELISATYGHIRRINTMVKRLWELREESEDQLMFRAVDLRSPFIVTSFDASYANERGSRSQGAFLNIATDKSILSGGAAAGLLEHGSRITSGSSGQPWQRKMCPWLRRWTTTSTAGCFGNICPTEVPRCAGIGGRTWSPGAAS